MAVKKFRLPQKTVPAEGVRNLLHAAIHAGLRQVLPSFSMPANAAFSPSSSSMRINWLYLALRSERQGAPVLICPQQRPTAMSAMVVSSVSPERWEHMIPQPFCLHIFTAAMDSERVPIWFTFKSSALHTTKFFVDSKNVSKNFL